jgi:hypothetical protein
MLSFYDQTIQHIVVKGSKFRCRVKLLFNLYSKQQGSIQNKFLLGFKTLEVASY